MGPSKYAICSYATDAGGAERGGGGNILYKRNPNIAHLQPIWPQRLAEAQRPAPPAGRPRRNPVMTDEAANDKDDTLSDDVD